MGITKGLKNLLRSPSSPNAPAIPKEISSSNHAHDSLPNVTPATGYFVADTVRTYVGMDGHLKLRFGKKTTETKPVHVK